MLAADAVRAAAVACLAVLVFAGALQLWELVVLVALYGAGTAFFTPAFEAIVPDLLPRQDLAAANSLDQFVRPIALRLAGPLLGGLLVAAGAGLAFAVDAASFAVSGIAVLATPAADSESGAVRLPRGRGREGLSFIRRRYGLGDSVAGGERPTSSSSARAKGCSRIVVKNEAARIGWERSGWSSPQEGFGAVGVGALDGPPGPSTARCHGHVRRPGRWRRSAIAGYGLAQPRPGS